MTVLVWQWGRHGAGPRFAAALAESMANLPQSRVVLSLSAQAELLRGSHPPDCAFPFETYESVPGMIRRALAAPTIIGPLAARLRVLNLQAAICAMPAPLDLVMAVALRRIGVPYTVVVHNAEPHDGDGMPLERTLQRWLINGARTLVPLTQHVANRIAVQGLARGKTLLLGKHPPFVFGPPPLPPRAHGGPLRLLCFGRIRPYKGLDLLLGALRLLGARPDMVVRVVGHGPESMALHALRALPNVTVENRWVPEEEVGPLMAWADALVLTYRDASQSGVAAAAIASGRWILATRVGGLAEQLQGEVLGTLCEPRAASIADALLVLLGRTGPLPSMADSTADWRRFAAMLHRATALA